MSHNRVVTDSHAGRPEVVVNRKGAERWKAGHPWIFRSDITGTGEAAGGDLVRVLDHRHGFLGIAQYSASSQIALRMLSKDADFSIADRIQKAQRFRDRVVRNSDAYRLVHAEADFLPALIIDRYADSFVVQTLNQAMDRALPEIVEALETGYRPKAIVARNDAAVRSLEELPREIKLLRGELPGPVPIEMNGFALTADIQGGQKTGIYLDQRENYLAAANYARGRALDCFTSTGGFALHLAKACERVEAVDSSAHALRTASANARANSITNIAFREADAFDLLASYSSQQERFDTVVLDPPAFAKSRKQIDTAARGYKDINIRALRLLNSGGTLITCSCSHHVSEGTLLQIVADASLDAGRTLRVLERRTQASDHPILLTVPETMYLKCLIFEVV